MTPTVRRFEGDAYDYALAAPGEAWLYPADGGARIEGERSGGVVRFTAPPAGVYWLAARTGEGAALTRPLRLVIAAVADPEEARLRRLVASLDQRIAEGEGVVFQLNDSNSGTQLTSIGLGRLREQRDRAASQLADYLRQRSGRRLTRRRI